MLGWANHIEPTSSTKRSKNGARLPELQEPVCAFFAKTNAVAKPVPGIFTRLELCFPSNNLPGVTPEMETGSRAAIHRRAWVAPWAPWP
jgi:hypothetical protein